MRRRLVWPVGPLLLSGKIDTVWPGLSNYLICNDGRFYDSIEYTPQKRSIVAAFLERYM